MARSRQGGRPEAKDAGTDSAAREPGGVDHGVARGGRGRSRHTSGGAGEGASVSDLRTISAIAPQVQSGRITPVELVQQCLDAARARAALNAFITVMGDEAIADAE